MDSATHGLVSRKLSLQSLLRLQAVFTRELRQTAYKDNHRRLFFVNKIDLCDVAGSLVHEPDKAGAGRACAL